MNITYGPFIKKHRISSGYKSQRKLALASGISAPTISRMEKEVQKPNTDTLKALAPYLTTTNIDELYVVCGYYANESHSQNPLDKQMKSGIEITNKEEVLKLDGKILTRTEKEKMISFLRFTRQENN